MFKYLVPRGTLVVEYQVIIMMLGVNTFRLCKSRPHRDVHPGTEGKNLPRWKERWNVVTGVTTVPRLCIREPTGLEAYTKPLVDLASTP